MISVAKETLDIVDKGSPVLLFIAALLRNPFHFFFPQQLAAYGDHHRAGFIGMEKPVWAI